MENKAYRCEHCHGTGKRKIIWFQAGKAVSEPEEIDCKECSLVELVNALNNIPYDLEGQTE